jgi:DNA-binding PadR family transcriptional regulator
VGALAADPSRWRYGYDLSAEAGITAGTMYPTLARLADDGLLEHRWELPAENGRPRHPYRLTDAGVEFAVARLRAARTAVPRGKPRPARS